MSLIAGVDVGNSTTEIVVADRRGRPVAWDRSPTRGWKGSQQASTAACALLRRVERRTGERVDQVVLTRQVPVLTFPVSITRESAPLGSLAIVGLGSTTPGGAGYAVGRPVAIEEPPTGTGGAVVLVARDPVGYRDTLAAIARWHAAGAEVVGVLLAGDEGVLVATRLRSPLPVVDGVDPELALQCTLVALEVARAGTPLGALADPIRLAHDLGLDADEIVHARGAAGRLRGHRCAVVGRMAVPADVAVPSAGPLAVLATGDTVPLASLSAALVDARVGMVRGLLGIGADDRAVDDAWLVDLAELDGLPGLRAGDVRTDGIVLAALASAPEQSDPRTAFEDGWDRVEVMGTEWSASRLGGLSTPGAPADSWVIDLGGGTLDSVAPGGAALVAAGCGDLLTVAVARALAVTTGAAEWVKRAPAEHVDAPHVVTDETGSRRFLEDAAPVGTVGWLVSAGPSGPLPFTRGLDLGQWRAVRLRLKQRALADNLARVLRSTPDSPARVIVQGGAAGDLELLQILNQVLPGTAVGRANVAGLLGHRWGVAYGLVLAALGAEPT